MDNATGGLVRYLVEKEHYKIPYKIYKNDFVIELNNSLETERPLAISNFFEKCSKNMAQFIDQDSLNVVMDQINKKYEEINITTNPDNRKIIDFLCGIENMPLENFMDVSGPLHFIMEVANDLEENKNNIPDSISVSCLLWSYVFLYELITKEICDRVIIKLKENPENNKDDLKQLKKFSMDGGHLMAGELNKILSHIIEDFCVENDSLFGRCKGSPKNLRNYISHSTIFFDSEKNMLVTLDGIEYDKSDLKREFSILFTFCTELIKESLGKKSMDDIINDIRKQFIEISKLFHEMERADTQRKAYHEIVLTWKKDSIKDK